MYFFLQYDKVGSVSFYTSVTGVHIQLLVIRVYQSLRQHDLPQPIQIIALYMLFKLRNQVVTLYRPLTLDKYPSVSHASPQVEGKFSASMHGRAAVISEAV